MAASSTDRTAPEMCGERLRDADDPPPKSAEHDPPAEDAFVDGTTAGALVRRDELFDRAESPHGKRGSEAPRPYTKPSEVFKRVPEMGELPVQHRPDALGPHDQIAVTKIPVHHPLGRARQLRFGEPPEPQLERRMGLTEPVELVGQLLERVTTDEAGNLGRRDTVDGGENPTALSRQDPPDVSQLLVPQDPARDRLAVDELGDEEGRPELLGPVPGHHDARHRNPSALGGHQQSGLERHARRRRPDAVTVTAQDKSLRGSIGTASREAPGFLGCSSGQSSQGLDDHGLPQRSADNDAQALGQAVGVHSRRLITVSASRR